MPDTDRKKLKDQQTGALLGAAGISDAAAAVRAMHSRSVPFTKTGSENAATNVAEAPMFTYPTNRRKLKVTGFGIAVASNVATDNTHYAVISFYMTPSAGSAKLVGSWNTHGGAQGALTFGTIGQVVTTALGLVTNADAVSSSTVGSTFTYAILKYGNGVAIPANSVFTVGLEEI